MDKLTPYRLDLFSSGRGGFGRRLFWRDHLDEVHRGV